MKHKVISRNKKLMPVKAQENENVFDPSEYRGIYKDLKNQLDEEIEHLRGEWIRE